MERSVADRWVSLLDSPQWRRLTKTGFARRVLNSPAFRDLNLVRRRWATARANLTKPHRFDAVENLCLFVGHTKSGGSLLGAMLDAHPEMAFADEADALRYVSAGFTADQLYALLVKGARREAQKGRITARRLVPYSLAMSGQWQGRHTKLKVIGDTRAGPTTRRLAADLNLLEELRTVTGHAGVRLVHVIRNPYDSISAMVLRSDRTFESAIADYFTQCENLQTIQAAMAFEELIEVRYESVTSRPSEQMDRICTFLGVEPSRSYLAACVQLIDSQRAGERHKVAWTAGHVASVARQMTGYPFLSGYSHDS